MGKKNVNIKRETANKLLLDLVKQAEYINSHPNKKDFPYTIKKLWVFGSMVNSDKPYLGDIDIFYELKCRWKDSVDASEFFIEKNNPSGFNSIIDRLYYGEALTLKILRNKHNAFSFVDIKSLPDFKPDPTKEMILKQIYEDK